MISSFGKFFETMWEFTSSDGNELSHTREVAPQPWEDSDVVVPRYRKAPVVVTK
jgi:hypothetical protein